MNDVWNCTKTCTYQNNQLYITENPLERVQNYKYLRMWMDVNLDWHYDIDVMRSKMPEYHPKKSIFLPFVMSKRIAIVRVPLYGHTVPDHMPLPHDKL